jgi:hypothetical protein
MDVLIKKCSSSFVVTRASSMRKQKLEESRQQAMTEIDVKPSNLDVENNSANMSDQAMLLHLSLRQHLVCDLRGMECPAERWQS